MSFFSFKKKNTDGYSLVFNINSGSVAGALVKITEKEGVNLIHYHKEPILFQTEISIPQHLVLMKKSLTAVAQNIQAEGFKKIIKKNKKPITIDKFFYLFSSPWCLSQTKIIKIREPKLFKVTENYINKLINDQGEKFQMEIPGSEKIIEKKIIQIKTNGYIVNDIYNKVIQDLELSVLFTIVPDDILNAVETAVSSVFVVKNAWCHSSTLSIFSAIRDLFPQKEDFIHIDISEEITDIFIVKDNTIVSNASLPYGRNHFIRELSTVLKVTEEIADSMIKMSINKSNDELAAVKLSVAMDTAGRNLLGKINDILNSFKEKIYVPNTIFLIVNNDLILFLKNKLSKHDFEVLLIDNKKIKSAIPIDDLNFRLGLMFLDKIYII